MKLPGDLRKRIVSATTAKRLFLGLVTAGISGLVCLLLLEAILRIFSLQPDFFFQLDPEVGAVHIPGKQGWHSFVGGRQWIEINEHGYRDREWSVEKPAGVHRIAVLGDSFVEGFQVPIESHFVRWIDQELGPRCDVEPDAVQAMNFGVSGFGTGQALATLEKRVLAFAPDVVLLYAYPSNDLFDNSREIDLEPNRLHFELDENGELRRLPYSVADHPVKRWLRHHSKAYLFLRDRLKRLEVVRRALMAARLMQTETIDEDRSRARDRDDSRNLLDARYEVPPPPPLERAWTITEALILEVRRTAEARGADFGVAIIPNREEVLGEFPGDPERSVGLDFDLAQRRMAEICERHDLRCLRLREPLREKDVPLDELYFPIDGHWTAHGHRVVAEASVDWLAPWACPAGSPGSSGSTE